MTSNWLCHLGMLLAFRFQPVIQEFACFSKEESKNVGCCCIARFTVPSRMWVCLCVVSATLPTSSHACCILRDIGYLYAMKHSVLLQNTVNVGQGRALVASESQLSSAIPFQQNLKTATGCVSFLTHPKHPELCQPSIAWVCVYACVANMPWHVYESALLTWPKITLPKLLFLAKKSLQGIRSARTASSGFPSRGFPEFPGEAECSDSSFLWTALEHREDNT